MKKIKSVLMVFTLASIVCFVMAFTIPASADDEIRLGLMDAMTGRNAKAGQDIRRATELLINKVNKKGGLLGKKLILVVEDDKADPTIGVSAIEKLVTKHKVLAITGFYSTAVTYAAFNAIQNHPDVPIMVTVGAIGQKIDDKFGQNDWFFHLTPYTNKLQANVASFYASLKPRPKTAALAYDDTLTGREGSKAIRNFIKEEGIKIVLDETYKAGSTDLSPYLTKVKSKNPDIFHMIAYLSDVILATKQMRELDFMPEMFGGPPALASPKFKQAVGVGATEGLISYMPFFIGVNFPASQKYPDIVPSTNDLIKEYEDTYKEKAGPVAIMGYVTMMNVVLGILEANSTNREDVIKAMNTLKTVTPLGHLDWHKEGNTLHQGFREGPILQYQKGKMECVYPADKATSTVIYPIPGWDKR
jgi:branched-chain amino acid transport system substrate-binding protein